MSRYKTDSQFRKRVDTCAKRYRARNEYAVTWMRINRPDVWQACCDEADKLIPKLKKIPNGDGLPQSLKALKP
jgi:hypothetical protein